MKIIQFILILTLLCACGYEPKLRQIRVRVTPRKAIDPFPLRTFTPPSDPLNFECFFLNVTGPGIGSDLSAGTLGSALLTPSCLGLGRVSSVVSSSTLQGSGIAVSVPTGLSRTVQLLGMSGTGASGCGSSSVTGVFQSIRPFMYELGRTNIDLLRDSNVTIKSSYVPGAVAPTELLNVCDNAATTSITLSPSLMFAGTSPDSSTNPGSPTFETLSSAGGTLPPSTFTAGSALAMTAQPISLSTGYRFSTTSTATIGASVRVHARVDILFSLDGIQLALYSSAKLSITAGGGGDTGYFGTSGLCNDPANTAHYVNGLYPLSSGFTGRVYKSGNWDAATQFKTTDSSIPLQNINLSASPATLAVSETNAGSTHSYIHFSLISNDVISLNSSQTVASGPCSAVQLNSISLTLTP